MRVFPPRQKKAAWTPVAALLVVGGLAGCGRDEGPADAATAADLDGRTFTATAAEGYRLIDEVTVAFDDGSVTAQGGCNTMGGAYRVGGGRLVVDELGQTAMGCDPGHMAQDAWLADLLGAGPEVTVTGATLELRAAGDALTLSDVASGATGGTGPGGG
jgi:heat shock protein HslJ